MTFGRSLFIGHGLFSSVVGQLVESKLSFLYAVIFYVLVWGVDYVVLNVVLVMIIVVKIL